ncbi:nuclear transport factor 2 family protein [Jannaschia aquimarina]|uniref:SnoaL-like domain-containing protein n=1 Tax=Jannaschia aquimarina TaxID=935700 RepID=A0A0D1EKW5_9RHOB|nr:nuclear transport factor 2 family protein [Jannaschia aquimarina]KIT18214.1 hypothetical protein jaqu_00140 [Jannaschia aquimarina]SNS83264.1 SnoaL-like domain-containing protein [Jannaschia aquimarina]
MTALKLLALILAASIPIPTFAAAQEGDTAAVIALANAVDRAVDAKDWDAALGYFAETIVSDQPGADPFEIPAAELVGGWEENLHADKASFHLRGTHVVAFTESGAAATVTSKAYAFNRVDGIPGGDLYEVWGDYEYDVVLEDGAWRITRFAFEPSMQRGNIAVVSHQPGGDGMRRP